MFVSFSCSGFDGVVVVIAVPDLLCLCFGFLFLLGLLRCVCRLCGGLLWVCWLSVAFLACSDCCVLAVVCLCLMLAEFGLIWYAAVCWF